MTAPILIGLHAVKGAGKDTTYSFIEQWAAKSDPAPTTRKGAFADRAKWAFARQFFPDISMADAVAWVDEHKDDQTAIIRGHRSDPSGDTPNPPQLLFEPVQLRQCMAQFSTESARMIYGGDFWVDQLLPEPSSRHPEGWHGNFMTPPKTDNDWPYSIADFCVITDVRFDEEVERIRELGGLNVKLRRRDAEQAVLDEAARKGRKVHMSEMGLPDQEFDVVLVNDDNDMDQSYRRTVNLMTEIQRSGVASIKRGSPRPWRIT